MSERRPARRPPGGTPSAPGRPRVLRGLLVACALVVADTGAAHDFWVRPSRFEATPGEVVDVRLFVGSGTELEELGRDPALVRRFESRRGQRHEPIGGVAGTVPAGRTRLAGAGLTTLVYQSAHSFIELPAGKFESYLDEEGLEEISFERQRRGQGLEPGRESYARYCKALVRVGGTAKGAHDDEVGLPLELVAEDDLSSWRDGDALSFRLLFGGRPLPGRLVRLAHLDIPELELGVRSDLQGRAVLTPPQGGAWRVVSVHMVPADPDVQGDWESFWTSLTFSLPE